MRLLDEIPQRIVLDLDGTLCHSDDGLYIDPPPRMDVIARVNEHRDRGCDVTIHTARGMITFEGDSAAAELCYRDATERWLRRYGVKYDRLIFGKPPGDWYIDDKGMTPNEFVG